MARTLRYVIVAAMLLGLGTVAEQPSAQEPVHVRGTLEAVDGDAIRVQSRDGDMLDLELKEESGVFKVTPAALDDIKSGDFVGITSIEAGGKRVALEVHLFAEDLRGIGEGHYPWDLVEEPNMMTNATIAEIKEVGADRDLQVTYAEGEGEQKTTGVQNIMVPPDVPIVLIDKGSKELLTPGKPLFLLVESSNQVVATVVGEGVVPPM